MGKLSLFRELIAKGVCSDDVEEGGDGEGDAGNTNFEDDVEGTGMGEGDGKNDVTDEIENEEQLLGLKGDDEGEQSNDQKELGEDEAETGMEMENEFDGELFDVPEKQQDENGSDNDDDDENEEENQNEEKFEK